MLDFQCPSCQAKCSVDDQFRGRKLRCPKCGTRIRHHVDGPIELLSVGEKPAAPAAAATPAPWQALSESPKAEPPPPLPPASEVVPPPTAPTTGLVTKLTRQSESKQNTIVSAGIGAAIVLVIAGIGLLTKDMKLSAAALAAGFGVAYVVLYVRAKRRRSRAPAAPTAPPAPRPAPAPVNDDEPTQPLAKA